MNLEGGKKSNAWHGPGSSLLRCPHPDCGHTAPIITKAHCRLYHDMEREEIGKRYGAPQVVTMRQAFKGKRGNEPW